MEGGRKRGREEITMVNKLKFLLFLRKLPNI